MISTVADTRSKFDEIQKCLCGNINQTFDNKHSLVNEIVYKLETFDEKIKVIPEKNAIHVVEEVQNDLLNSVIFACQGFYRNAYICLRSAIELLLSFLYYYDHQYEFLLWKNDYTDMRWTSLIDSNKGIFNNKFVKIVSGLNLDMEKLKQNITNVYHEMSQSVHGKYDYMQINISEKISFNSKIFDEYARNFKVIIEVFEILIYIRFKTELQKTIDSEELGQFEIALKEVSINE